MYFVRSAFDAVFSANVLASAGESVPEKVSNDINESGPRANCLKYCLPPRVPTMPVNVLPFVLEWHHKSGIWQSAASFLSVSSSKSLVKSMSIK